MSLGYVGASANGTVSVPSPSIWADCLNTVLNDKGLGYYLAQDFLGGYNSPASTALAGGIETYTGVGTSVIDAAASGTYGPNVLSMATGATDANNVAIHGEELGQIVRNSGNKVWFEARVAAAALGDTAFFIGLSTRAAVRTTTTGLLIASGLSNNGAATTVAASTIGFISVQASSAIATVNARYTKTSGTAVTVLADVTNASALQAYQATLPTGTVITQAAGVTAQTTAPIGEGINIAYGNLVAASFRKFGVRFDGYTKLEFYVDGNLVARQEVDSTIDQTAYYVPIVAAKNGASTALTLEVDFVRAAFQARS